MRLKRALCINTLQLAQTPLNGVFMKEHLIFSILLYITKHKNTTATEIAKEFEISTRSVYRYIDTLSLIGIPVITKLGRGGGITLVRDYLIEGIMLTNYEKSVLKKFINGDEGSLEKTKKIITKLI